MAALKEFEDKLYCDVTTQATNAIAGKDILLCIFNATGEKLLAIDGQQSLTLNREKEIIEINSKTIDGGWKTKAAGPKDWSIESDGMYSPTLESHQLLAQAYEEDEYVCCKIVDNKRKKPLFGGLALIKEFNLEAPYDDSMTFEMTLEGCGKLTDLTKSKEAPAMPGEGGMA